MSNALILQEKPALHSHNDNVRFITGHFSLNLFCHSMVANLLLTHAMVCCPLVLFCAFQHKLTVVCMCVCWGEGWVMENARWGSQRTYIISLIAKAEKYVGRHYSLLQMTISPSIGENGLNHHILFYFPGIYKFISDCNLYFTFRN